MYNLSQYLNFNDEMRTLGRPVENYTSPLTVSLSVLLYAILDVVSGWSFQVISSVIFSNVIIIHFKEGMSSSVCSLAGYLISQDHRVAINKALYA